MTKRGKGFKKLSITEPSPDLIQTMYMRMDRAIKIFKLEEMVLNTLKMAGEDFFIKFVN